MKPNSVGDGVVTLTTNSTGIYIHSKISNRTQSLASLRSLTLAARQLYTNMKPYKDLNLKLYGRRWHPKSKLILNLYKWINNLLFISLKNAGRHVELFELSSARFASPSKEHLLLSLSLCNGCQSDWLCDDSISSALSATCPRVMPLRRDGNIHTHGPVKSHSLSVV